MKPIEGVITALVTPFKNGKIDEASLENLVKVQLRAGVNGFVINGTTAESPTITEEERKKIFYKVKEIAPSQCALIIGTGSNSTQKTIEDTVLAQEWGADAALVVVPYYNKPPQRGLFAHFKAVAESVRLPIVLYNVPSRTITSLNVDTIQALNEIPNIVGIKEASGDISFAKQIKQNCRADFTLLSGDDGTYVDFLEAGGAGVISVSSHIMPEVMLECLKLGKANKWEESKSKYVKYKKLIDLLFREANPIPVKKALQQLGIIETAQLRLPLVEAEESLAEILRQEMAKVGLLK